MTANSSNTAVTLSWQGVPNALSYKIYRSTIVGGVSGSEVLAGTTSGTTFTDTDSTTTAASPPTAIIGTTYFRYTSNDLLAYEFGPSSFARLEAAMSVADQTALYSNSLPDSSLDVTQVGGAHYGKYADVHNTYDSSNRIYTRVVQGEGCSACSDGLGTYTYTYDNSGTGSDYQSWKYETKVLQPDGSYQWQFFNAFDQQMLEIDQNIGVTPAGAMPTTYLGTYTQYDNQGMPTLVASPPQSFFRSQHLEIRGAL